MQPLLHVALLSIFLGRFARVPSDGVPYFIFCLSGIIIWQYTSATVSARMLLFGATAALIKKVYFPRLVLPLSASFPQLVDLGINLALTALLITVVYHLQLSFVNLLWLPLYLLLAVVTTFGAVCWFDALRILFFDMRHLVPVIMQLWLICSPVMYPATLVPEEYRPLYWLNPMAIAIAGVRWSLLSVGDPPELTQLTGVLVSATLSLTGAIFYIKVSKWFGDII